MDDKLKYRLQGAGTMFAVISTMLFATIKLAPNILAEYAVNRGMDKIRNTVIGPIMERIPESAAVTSTEEYSDRTSYNLSFDFSDHVSETEAVISGLASKLGNSKLSGKINDVASKLAKDAFELAKYQGTFVDQYPLGLSVGDKLKLDNGKITFMDVSVDTEWGVPILRDNITGRQFDAYQNSVGVRGVIINAISEYLER